MKIKIRGHNRIWKNIDQWVLSNKKISIEDLISSERCYVKFRISPWVGSTRRRTKSIVPEPKAKTKQKILNGLFEIYDTWKIELDKLGEPYYLKIWLFEDHFSNSQVVCAIRDKIDFYDGTFSKPTFSKKMNRNNFGSNQKLGDYNWELRLDEDFYSKSDIGEPSDFGSETDYLESKKWFEQLMKNPHTTYPIDNPTDDYDEYYGFVKGNVWLGEKK